MKARDCVHHCAGKVRWFLEPSGRLAGRFAGRCSGLEAWQQICGPRPLPQAKERAAVREGKKPFFLKKADKRKAELVAQYGELQKAGQLDKYLAKRRRKNAAKDHRYVPSARAS